MSGTDNSVHGRPSADLGSLAVLTIFSEPAFELAHGGPGLYRSMYRGLEEFDLDASGFEESNAGAGLADWLLVVNLESFTVRVKVRVNGMEVMFVGASAWDAALQRRISTAIEDTILPVARPSSAARRVFNQQSHWQMSSEEIRRRIPSVTLELPGHLKQGLGSPAGHGVGLFFESPLFSDRANLVLDRSVALKEGLFVQVRCEFAAAEFDLLKSMDNFHAYSSNIWQAFELADPRATHASPSEP